MDYFQFWSQSLPFRSDGWRWIHAGRGYGWGGAGQGVVLVDVDPQGVLPDDGAGHRAGPGDDHPRIALGGSAAARAGQFYQVSGVAITREGEGRLAFNTLFSQSGSESEIRTLVHMKTKS